MADEWIKMRVSLSANHKVVAMADALGAMPEFRLWATGERDRGVPDGVTERVVRSSLVDVWGAARRDGDRDGEDVVIRMAKLKLVDRISGVPGFGEAMRSVGWVVEGPDGSLVFPKLLPHLVSAEEWEREKDRQRKRRIRGDVQAAPRECPAGVPPDSGECPAGVPPDSENVRPREEREKRREEEKNPPTPQGGLPFPPAEKPTPPAPAAERPIPASLDTPEFRDAWSRWEAHRREKRQRLTPTCRASQLKRLAAMGAARAVAALDHSIGSGWTGIFEPGARAPPPAVAAAGGETLEERIERLKAGMA